MPETSVGGMVPAVLESRHISTTGLCHHFSSILRGAGCRRFCENKVSCASEGAYAPSRLTIASRCAMMAASATLPAACHGVMVQEQHSPSHSGGLAATSAASMHRPLFSPVAAVFPCFAVHSAEERDSLRSRSKEGRLYSFVLRCIAAVWGVGLLRVPVDVEARRQTWQSKAPPVHALGGSGSSLSRRSPALPP